MRLRIFWLRLKDRWFYARQGLTGRLNGLALTISTLLLFVGVYDFGFESNVAWYNATNEFFGWAFALLGLLWVLRTATHIPRSAGWRIIASEAGMALVLTGMARFHLSLPYSVLPDSHVAQWFEILLHGRIISHLLIVSVFAIELSKSSLSLLQMRLNPSLLYMVSFLLLIALGTGLLLLPRATPDSGIGFIDALFTATSAVCVTGLIVVDTAHAFTPLGQGIILLLIQIGGLGVIIFTSFFGFFFQGSPSFQSQIMLKDFIHEEKLGHVFKTLIKIIVFTLFIELLGAFLIYLSLAPANHPASDQAWFAVFHSVSAFCNAGFSVFSNGLADEQMGVSMLYNMHLIIAILIILGGIGFPVMSNFYSFFRFKTGNVWQHLKRRENLHHVPRLININTRIVILSSFFLIVIGTLSFRLSEDSHSLAGLSTYGKWVSSFFAAVTPRTAGFNTFDPGTMALPALLLTMFLMWVGASPGSAGGGIKTSTLSLALINIWHLARGRERVELFRREISSDSLRRAFGIIVMSVLVISLCVFLLSLSEPKLPLRWIVFEAISAFSTVGLSLGATTELSLAGKLTIIFTMFVGRIGTLTILVALFRSLNKHMYRYPSESIYIN